MGYKGTGQSRSVLHRPVSISFEQNLHQLFQWSCRARQSWWLQVGTAPECSSGCGSSICTGTAQTWLQWSWGVGALDLQHLRNSDLSLKGSSLTAGGMDVSSMITLSLFKDRMSCSYKIPYPSWSLPIQQLNSGTFNDQSLPRPCVTIPFPGLWMLFQTAAVGWAPGSPLVLSSSWHTAPWDDQLGSKPALNFATMSACAGATLVSIIRGMRPRGWAKPSWELWHWSQFLGRW